VVGIDDEDTWAYSEELLNIAATKGYRSIKLLRAMDILGYTDGKPKTWETYRELAPIVRQKVLEEYGRTEEEIREMILNDHDSNMTYRGFIRFLETDLKYSPVAKEAKSGCQFRKVIKKVAMNMMIRAEVIPADFTFVELKLNAVQSFTKLLQAKCTSYVRLSIHPSTGAVKLSVPLLPQPNGAFPKSPWHCSIAAGLDGSYRTVHAKDVRDSHELIHVAGRPYFYRERSELWDWEDKDVVFRPLYPSGVYVVPADGVEGRALTDDEIRKLKELAQLQPVTAAGFANVQEHVF
jgi:hypothetical protein